MVDTNVYSQRIITVVSTTAIESDFTEGIKTEGMTPLGNELLRHLTGSRNSCCYGQGESHADEVMGEKNPGHHAVHAGGVAAYSVSVGEELFRR